MARTILVSSNVTTLHWNRKDIAGQCRWGAFANHAAGPAVDAALAVAMGEASADEQLLIPW